MIKLRKEGARTDDMCKGNVKQPNFKYLQKNTSIYRLGKQQDINKPDGNGNITEQNTKAEHNTYLRRINSYWH